MAEGTSNTAQRRIDVHHHVLPPQYVDSTPMPFRVPETDAQLATMAEFGIPAAMTSLTPRVFHNHRHRRAVARDCNEFMAGLVRDHPARFGSFAVLPLPDVDGALEEVAYALDTLHLDGVGLLSSMEGRFLGTRSTNRYLPSLNRRRAVVFVHPLPLRRAARIQPGGARGHHRVHLRQHARDPEPALPSDVPTNPDIRIIFCHGGSVVPYLAHRIANLEHNAGVPDVIGTLRSFYYDVASAMSRFALPSLQQLADPTHIVWGSDLPFVHGERLREEIQGWEAFTGFDAATRAAIERDNALRLFPALATE